MDAAGRQERRRRCPAATLEDRRASLRSVERRHDDEGAADSFRLDEQSTRADGRRSSLGCGPGVADGSAPIRCWISNDVRAHRFSIESHSSCAALWKPLSETAPSWRRSASGLASRGRGSGALSFGVAASLRSEAISRHRSSAPENANAAASSFDALPDPEAASSDSDCARRSASSMSQLLPCERAASNSLDVIERRSEST